VKLLYFEIRIEIITKEHNQINVYILKLILKLGLDIHNLKLDWDFV
jgi:hypothetical protein